MNGIRADFEKTMRAISLEPRKIMANDPTLYCQLIEIFSLGYAYGKSHEVSGQLMAKPYRDKSNSDFQDELRSVFLETAGIYKKLGISPWAIPQ